MNRHRRRAGTDRTGRGGGDSGQVAGIEVLPFGFLMLVSVTLLVVNAWAVVQTKLAVDAAAREGVRAYVEASDGATADVAAAAGAASALIAHGGDPDRAVIGPAEADGFVRCGRVRYTVSYEIDAIRVPWIGGIGDVTVSSTHSETIDAYRTALSDEGLCP